MSGDAAQDYFSDGISEELINALGRAGGLRLAAATSSFSFKGRSATIGDIARRLNVGAVLEGSVRRDAARLRISADLVDATTGYQLWANTYDRNSGDIFQVQQDIAQAVAASLKAALKADEIPKLALGSTTNPKAFDAYLRGIAAYSGTSLLPSDRRALEAFNEAIAIDPNFADAHVQRALALMDLVEFGWEPDTTKTSSMLEDALSASNRAISIAPDLGWAYAARASAELDLSLDFALAATDFARAKALSPNNPWINLKYGLFQIYLGHLPEGVAAVERAIAADPLDAGAHMQVADAYFLVRRFADSLAALRHAEALGGQSGPLRSKGLHGFIDLISGAAEAARQDCEAGRDVLEAECMVIALHALGKLPEAERALASLKAAIGDGAAYNYAEIYAQWGQPDQALHWLSRAFDLKDVGLVFLKVDPFLDPIRNTPEFMNIEKKMGFPA